MVRYSYLKISPVNGTAAIAVHHGLTVCAHVLTYCRFIYLFKLNISCVNSTIVRNYSHDIYQFNAQGFVNQARRVFTNNLLTRRSK